jgi:hypothetical protein
MRENKFNEQDMYRCWSEGSQLFHPESADEAETIFKDVITDPTVDLIHIGILKYFPDRPFMTINGWSKSESQVRKLH